jgi:DNA primase
MTTEDESQLPTEIDIDIARDNLEKLYHLGAAKEINPERWERARRDIRFEDVVAELTGLTGEKISCPFHGPETIPSFQIYKRTNDGYCFGCGENFDSVRFVSRITGLTRVKALMWLEKKWELPPMEDVSVQTEDEDIDEEETVEVSFDDLEVPYITNAAAHIQEFKDAELAEEYVRIFFEASEYMADAKRARTECDDPEEGAEEAAALESKAALTLAKVVGRKKIQQLLNRKKTKSGKY